MHVLILSVSAFIFALDIPKSKKVIWMWLSVVGSAAALFFILTMTRNVLGINPLALAAVSALIGAVFLSIIIGIFWFLLRFDEHKQVRILILIIIPLLILLIVQLVVFP